MFDMGDQPMSLVAMQTSPEQSAALERHPIKLDICRHCSHVFNSKFDSMWVNYSAEGCRMYNDGSGWQTHIDDVYTLLHQYCRVDLVIEIGAGDCEFLHGLDLDSVTEPHPIKMAVDPCKAVERAEELGLVWAREPFMPEHLPLDAPDSLVIMRHLLEHMERPRDVLESVANRAFQRDHKTYIYIEVPNCEVALERGRIEDWTYEHAQHFTMDSMRALFHNCGLDRIMILSKYNREVLCCLACVDPNERSSPSVDVDAVLETYRTATDNIEVERDWMHANIDRIVFWGGAGKSAMFLRRFGLIENTVVVDSHDEKWGMYVPGTKIKIQPPGAVRSLRPDYIIATTSWRANDIRDEIVTYGYPCLTLMKFENGKLVEVPLGR
jgi:hypothetical protein